MLPRLGRGVESLLLAGIPGVERAWAPERARQPEVEMGIPLGTERNLSEVNDSNRIDSREDTKRLRAFVGRAVDTSPFGILPTMTEAAPEGLPEGVLLLPMVLAAAPAVGREPPRPVPERGTPARGDGTGGSLPVPARPSGPGAPNLYSRGP